MIKVDGCDDDYDYNDEGDGRCDMAGALDYEPHAIAPDHSFDRGGHSRCKWPVLFEQGAPDRCPRPLPAATVMITWMDGAMIVVMTMREVN